MLCDVVLEQKWKTERPHFCILFERILMTAVIVSFELCIQKSNDTAVVSLVCLDIDPANMKKSLIYFQLLWLKHM